MGRQLPLIYKHGTFRRPSFRKVVLERHKSYRAAELFDEVLPGEVRIRELNEADIVDERLRCRTTEMDREFWSLDAGRQAAGGQRERVWQRVFGMTSSRIQGWRSRTRS